jgi:stress response protein YsnF
VVEERLVISKELVLIEEIHMHKFSSTQEVARTIPLTRLEVTIDDDDKK